MDKLQFLVLITHTKQHASYTQPTKLRETRRESHRKSATTVAVDHRTERRLVPTPATHSITHTKQHASYTQPTTLRETRRESYRKPATSSSPSITTPNDASSLHQQRTQSLIQNNMLHTLSLLNCVRQGVRVTGNLSLSLLIMTPRLYTGTATNDKIRVATK